MEDDGTITGCIDFDTQNIIESIYDKTIPNLVTDIELVTVEDKHIMKIIVEKSYLHQKEMHVKDLERIQNHITRLSIVLT